MHDVWALDSELESGAPNIEMISWPTKNLAERLNFLSAALGDGDRLVVVEMRFFIEFPGVKI